MRFHIQHAALGAFLLLKPLKDAPELIGRLGRSRKEGLVARIRLVILLNEIAHIDFFAPNAPFKAFPLLKMNHANSPLFRLP